MNITSEIIQYEIQLDKLLKEVRNFDITDPLYPSLLNYACIRITGYVEQSFDSLILAYIDKTTNHPALRNVAVTHVNGYNSANYKNIGEILSSFDIAWFDKLKLAIQQENNNPNEAKKDLVQLLNSLYSLRNSIAHGGNNLASLKDLRRDYEAMKKFVRLIASVIP